MPAYKDEERGTWYASFYYKDWTGKRKLKKKRGFSKKKDAQNYEREFILSQNQSCDMLFETFLPLYYNWAEKIRRNRESTIDNKKQIIDSHIMPYFAKKKMNEVTANSIHEWQQEIIGLGYKDTYLRTINSILSAIFNYAVNFYGLSKNPCRQAGYMGSKKPETINFWTLDEFETFIPSISDKPRAKTALNILFWSGIREGELLGLLPTDLLKYDNGDYALNIDKQWLESQKKFGPPKTAASIRVTPIPKFLGIEIETYMSMLYECPNDERIFYGATKSFFAREIERGCKKTGIKRIRVHDLRHSHVSLLIDLGYSDYLIAERIGHEDINYIRETYGHLYPNKHSEVVKKLESLRD